MRPVGYAPPEKWFHGFKEQEHLLSWWAITQIGERLPQMLIQSRVSKSPWTEFAGRPKRVDVMPDHQGIIFCGLVQYEHSAVIKSVVHRNLLR
jgi:hypothetical protein